MTVKITAFILFLSTSPAVVFALPVPKEGLLIPKDAVDEIRARIIALGDHPWIKQIEERTEEALKDWPEARIEIEKHVGHLLDLVWENNPKEHVPETAAKASEWLYKMVDSTPGFAFMYLLTGQKQYAGLCYEIIEMAGRVPRWGWFNWDGANMPQIRYGMVTRDVAVAIDWCWNGWDQQQKSRAIEIIAEKGVESYWRLVNHTPFMGFHHLRSKNQGNNALAAALIASLTVGDNLPENKVWMDTLIHSFSWIVAHDIGWAGQGLESGLPGYWSVSMQNLYTAAAALNNARGIDFRVHPGFAEATYYPFFLEATVPPAGGGGRFDEPLPKDVTGASSIIGSKPIELPHRHGGCAWWFDYAANFPESPAGYFVSRIRDARIEEGHQAGVADVLKILWVALAEKPGDIHPPTALFRTTDRMSMFRSGYGSPHTYLYFNGDIFLSSRNEILCTTSGLAWHFPWHQYAVTESVLETGGRLFSPSMVVMDYSDSDFVSMIHAESGTSDVKYYLRPGQAVSHRNYKERDRDIICVRSKDQNAVYDYFLFIDRVEHDAARWHSFNWHIWNSPGNEGNYHILSPNMAIAHRPNADILLATLSHEKMTYETQGIPSQPIVSYVMDHNALLLRAIAGEMKDVDETPQTLTAKLWSEGETVEIDGRTARHFSDFKGLKPVFEAPLTLTPGVRYRISVQARERNVKVYENFAWKIDLTLLDGTGSLIQKVETQERDPDPLRLTDPASFRPDYDWLETATYLDAPTGVDAIRAELFPATWAHMPHELKADSEVWLSDITVTPLGIPERKGKEMLVTMALPLEKDAEIPKITSTRSNQGIRATVAHPDGTYDTIEIAEDGHTQIARFSRSGQGEFAWDQESASKVGSPSSLKVQSEERLASGLAPWTEMVTKERDKYTSKGWENIALDAEVSASGMRDPRFPPQNVIDNKTWEFPADGRLDYSLGEIQTTQGFGYGRGERMSYVENMSSWPFYIPPTYWLLPYRQTGHVTLKLKESTRIKMVRVLNTSNAGLHDYGTVDFRVELLDENQNPVYTRNESFGKAWDRAFQAAFAKPDFFNSYGATFEGLLEPGVKVPFGDGWKDIEMDCSEEVRYVRISVLSYWALGGGFNEIQVYTLPGMSER